MSVPPNDDDEFVRRKVIVEQGMSSGSARSNAVTIIILAVLALALVAYILMHMHH
jgi:hypothetical protein